MRFTDFSFGWVRIDGVTYEHDVIIDRGKIRKRKKAASKRFRRLWAHPALDRGGHPLAMPPAGDRHRRQWRAARDEASETRGLPPQG